MASFDSSTAKELEKPILKGTLCAGRFSSDGKWYRARVLGSAGKNEGLRVQFIDFGNGEVLRAERGDLKKLPQNLLAYQP